MKNSFQFSKVAAVATALSLTLASAAFAQGDLTPRITALKATEPIVIDGLADDNAWERGVVSYGFLSSRNAAKPNQDTRARVLYDRQFLYVALTASEKDGGANGADTVGLQLRFPGANGNLREVEIMATPANRVTVKDVSGGGRTVPLQGLKSAVKKRAASWDVELAIPFAGLGIEDPRIGDVWEVNFLRNRSGGESASSTAFPGFGELRFGRDLLVYLWSKTPYSGDDEVMVYNDSEQLRQLLAQVISASSGKVISETPIYMTPGHRRQHFPIETPEGEDYYILVRQTDRPDESDDDRLVVWRPYVSSKR